VIALFNAIIALASMFKIGKELLDSFAVYYFQKKLAEMKEENRLAIKKAIEEHDQRDIEKALGNPNAGEASYAAGSEIVDHLPGVGGPQ
jgi:hypothetical protein